MSQGVPGVPPGRWWGALRIALVLLWLLGATTTWWTAPRQQDYDRARADVVAGRVTAYQWGDRWEVDRSPLWFGSATLWASGSYGPLFAWRTPDGRLHWTDTDRFGQVTTTGADARESYSGAGAVGIARELRAAGLEHRAGDVHAPVSVVGGAGILLAVVALVVVVAGPAPVRGTRWFWFWLIFLTPCGLGLLAWTARERPWSRSAAAVAARSPAYPRDRGVLGFGIGVFASVLAGVVLLFLHEVLGDWWVPRPDA
ncbi:hypothetical protein [Micromonospora sp. HUAS LYJ1]|uniref:hypothetical protein n=1 Tax=Micromonospora sp. HUAS LYJ1 TaxID=3061626 RepID=UPI0026725542|nr:hypothetical protein [Micromonospora sp. HUAS LYJ1]WKU05755.1 hypothetical protein Q2K16_01410 [Micromonospora sp. HUAS LYJ1]